MSSLLDKSIQSGKWLSIGYILQRVIGFGSFFILARILDPADFGIMAIVLLVPKFLQSTTETGFSAAVIQQGEATKKYLNPIWTIAVMKSTLILVTVFFAGPIIARYFHIEHALLAVQLGGLFIFIQNLYNVGEIYFFKDIHFKKIFIRNLVREVSYVVIALLVVLVEQSYWALFIGTLAAYTAQTISTYVLHPYRPRLTLRFGVLKELFNFSKWLVAQNWIVQLGSFIEQATVARSTNPVATGLYVKGRSVASVPSGFLSSVMNAVSFAAYSKVQANPDSLRRGLIRSLHILFFVMIPTALLLLAAAGKLIIVFLGAPWLPMAAVLKILLFYFIINNIIEISFTLLNATGHPDKRVKFDLIQIPLTIVLILTLTPRFEIVGAASALVLGALPSLLLHIRALTRLTRTSVSAILGTALVPILCSLMFFLPAILWKEGLLSLPTSLFVLTTTLAGVVYVGAIWAIGRWWSAGPYDTLRLIAAHIRRKKASA